jgi:poly(beta-D-mannuronate) lyase
MRISPFIAISLAAAAAGLQTRAAEHRVASAEEIEQLTGSLLPGDVLVMTDGTWKDQAITINGRGTAEQPVTVRPQTPGKVILTGTSTLVTRGQYVVITGLLFKDTAASKDTISIHGEHCRLTESAIIGGTSKVFVHLHGTENRVDHCYLSGKTSESPTVQVEADGTPNRHRIDHNHFGPRPPLGRNGGETIRIGYSWQSMNVSATLVEQNLFEHCDGELEIISNKSCENIYRGNTFLECAGTLTLRHGDRCTVDSNFFFARNKKGSGGIRIIGEGHTVINNYIDGVEMNAFWITSGIPDSPLVGYVRARDCTIAFNTVVHAHGACLDLSAGLGTANRSLLPENITIANNLFMVAPKGTLLKGSESQTFRWLGNIASAGAGLAEHPGVRQVDPSLTFGSDGIWRPGPGTPPIASAEGDSASIKTDIDGQPRTDARDVGCDQLSSSPITNRPLRGTDVGPSWRERGAAESS